MNLRFVINIRGVEKNYPNDEHEMAKFTFSITGKHLQIPY